MKYYSFVETDEANNIIAFPYPYFNIYEDIPCPFFTLEDVKTHNGFNSICQSKMKKIINGKVGEIIKLSKLCRWSSVSGGPLFHAIYIMDENSDLYYFSAEKEKLDKEIKDIKKQLNEIDLYKRLAKKEQERNAINKKFKSIMK